LKDLNQKDHLGKKSNRGFYKWEKGKKVKERKLKLNDDEQRNLAENLIQPLINRTAELVTEGVVENEEMADAGVIFGTGFAPFLGGPINFSKNNKIESL
jgi:3-hydroxyacyl-CoA dehydrogenase/enoyl-CoA hydratase/3-hydroxybutyryl-CoA epimerase